MSERIYILVDSPIVGDELGLMDSYEPPKDELHLGVSSDINTRTHDECLSESSAWVAKELAALGVDRAKNNINTHFMYDEDHNRFGIDFKIPKKLIRKKKHYTIDEMDSMECRIYRLAKRCHELILENDELKKEKE